MICGAGKPSATQRTCPSTGPSWDTISGLPWRRHTASGLRPARRSITPGEEKEPRTPLTDDEDGEGVVHGGVAVRGLKGVDSALGRLQAHQPQLAAEPTQGTIRVEAFLSSFSAELLTFLLPSSFYYCLCSYMGQGVGLGLGGRIRVRG